MGDQPKSLIEYTPLRTMDSIVNSENPKKAILEIIKELKGGAAVNSGPFFVKALAKLDSIQAEINKLTDEQCKKYASENINFIGGMRIYGSDGILPRLADAKLLEGDFDKVLENFVIASVKPKTPEKFLKRMKDFDTLTKATIEVSALAAAIEKKAAPPKVAAQKPTCALPDELLNAIQSGMEEKVGGKLPTSLEALEKQLVKA